MHSSISSFERIVPYQPWRPVLTAVLVLIAAAAVSWELKVRSWGYGPCLNDTEDLWADRRNAVRPDSLVIIGDSRPHFDLDLDELQKGLGQRPIQLALDGSCVYPILANLANDESFHGTVICSVVPGMFLAPGGPLVENSQHALDRYHHWTWAQRSSHQLAMLLEERIAFLKEGELNLNALLKKIPIPPRPGTGGPALPPYFASLDRERRARMVEQCANPGPLQDRVKYGWIPLFTPPPPPPYITDKAAFGKKMGMAVEQRFHDAATAVGKIRARGGKVVLVRFPMSGQLKELEAKATPRAGPWTRLVHDTGAPGIYFEDYPELSSFECPEWSHLSAPDSIEFTKRLVPHLQKALAM